MKVKVNNLTDTLDESESDTENASIASIASNDTFDRAYKSGWNDRADSRLVQRDISVGATAHDASGLSRNVPLSQMDRMDITKMNPRELMLLERQYGAGWLKQLAPTQHMRLQNTLGGTSITSATPTALSSHMDPKALAVAAGIGATTFAPMGKEDDENMSNVDRQYSYERDGTRERSMSDGQEYVEEPEPEERFTSDLMQATTIGENHHNVQYTTIDMLHRDNGHYTPLLEKDPIDFVVQQPKTVTYQKQPEIKFPLNKQDASLACELNIGDINNYRLRRGSNDGTFCYSIFLIIGVLLMGIGIILYILQALLGYKAVESIVGGIMFVSGVVVLICSMIGWKRRAVHNEKKMVHV